MMVSEHIRPAGGKSDLREALGAMGLGDLEGVFSYADGQDLVKQGLGHRRRTRLTVEDSADGPQVVYLKRYNAEPLMWRLRRWWTYGLAASPASIEAENIEDALAAGLATMRVVAYGQAGGLANSGKSYIIVTAVPGESLSRCIDGFLATADEAAQAALAGKLAELAGRLHKAGLVHRDFYTAHVFLDNRDGRLGLWLIDLARCFRPAWLRRFRWQVKDMAQLKYSLPGGFVEKHWPALIREYLRCSGRGEERLAGMERAIDRKVGRMKRRELRKRGRTR